MNYYSQKNPAWKDQQLGSCNDTIGNSGCKVSCYGMLVSDDVKSPRGDLLESNPSIIDWILTDEGLYQNGCMTVDEVFAKRFGLKYNGRSNKQPDYPCIAETNHYADLGVSQHFFMVFPDGKIVDPLDINPQKKDNKYNIVSYRLIEPKNNSENDCCQRLNEANKIIKDLEKKLKEINNISNI